jgi:hypothetical protein
MSTPLDLITNLLNQYKELKALYDTKREEQGEIDRELSDYYHCIEGIDITHVSQSHKMIKRGKDILERRRNIKFETLLIKASLDNMSISIEQIRRSVKIVIDKDKAVRQEIKDRARI